MQEKLSTDNDCLRLPLYTACVLLAVLQAVYLRMSRRVYHNVIQDIRTKPLTFCTLNENSLYLFTSHFLSKDCIRNVFIEVVPVKNNSITRGVSDDKATINMLFFRYNLKRFSCSESPSPPL